MYNKPKCSKCNEFHQILIPYHDCINYNQELICLTCIARIVEGRMHSFVTQDELVKVLHSHEPGS